MVKRELLLTLNLFSNQLTPGSEQVKGLLKELESFGPISAEGLRKYRLSATSSFFDYSEIIKQIKILLAEEIGLPDAKTAWGQLQTQIGRYGSRQKPTLEPVMSKTVDALGGWSYLCKSRQQVADRSNFYKIYQTFYNQHLTGILYDRSRKSVTKPTAQ